MTDLRMAVHGVPTAQLLESPLSFTRAKNSTQPRGTQDGANRGASSSQIITVHATSSRTVIEEDSVDIGPMHASLHMGLDVEKLLRADGLLDVGQQATQIGDALDDLVTVYASKVLKKRRRKMNRHKYKKWRKKMRSKLRKL